MNIQVIKNEDNWIAINKPQGLSVHNQEDSENVITLLDKMNYTGYSPVNRLDKETSGVMLLSKDSKTTASLQKTIQDDSVKIYTTVVRGSVKKKTGAWNNKMTNKAEGRVSPLGKSEQRVLAKTEYKVLKQSKYISLLQIQIHTGRQHQIRKHCAFHKHQILGDPRYGDKKYNQLVNKIYSFSAMALHSTVLKFQFNGKNINLEAALPATWSAFDQELTSAL